MIRQGVQLSLIAWLASLAIGLQAFAQPVPRTGSSSGASSKPRTTIIEMKLLADPNGGALYSQQWAKLLEPLDVSVQILRPSSLDKVEVKDREVGTIRYVTAVGSLDRTGRISFPGRSFELSDATKLRDWITELKTFGAQGTPENQPMWGFSKEQFNRLYDSLLKPAGEDLRETSLKQAVTKLPLPSQYPMRWSAAASELIAKPGAKTRVRQDVRGFTSATALAIALNDCGLGFRPNRTPSDGLELLIEPLGQRKDLWPIGWPLQQQRIKAAPKFFSMTQIELNEVNLADLVTTVSELTETPILLDYHEIEQAKLDVDKMTVSFKPAKTSWGVALKNMVVPKKLSREIWQDEAGRAFVWITTNRPGRSNNE